MYVKVGSNFQPRRRRRNSSTPEPPRRIPFGLINLTWRSQDRLGPAARVTAVAG
jgi:hypothetical protein